MDDYEWIFWLALLPAILAGQIYFLGVRMSNPEKMIKPIPDLTPFQLETIQYYQEWLDSVNLRFLASFRFGSIQVVVFQEGNNPRFFSIYFHQRVTFCGESYLEDLTILDTATSGSPDLFPRPGAFKQSFPNLPPIEMWQRHIEGETHLAKKFGYNFAPLQRPYQEILAAAMRVRMNHNRAQLFWPFRVLYRFAVTGQRLRNRTIAQQFPL